MATPQVGRIFISYRREENGWPARQLYEVLSERFGEERVFKDVDSIEPGDDFVDRLTSAVSSCHVLLALIGRNWLTTTDGKGNRRLADPGDFVRLEIETALHRGVRVIPILVDDAQMPRAEELPAGLRKLVRRQAIAINPITFNTERLVRTIETTLDEVEEKSARSAASSSQRPGQPAVGHEITWPAPGVPPRHPTGRGSSPAGTSWFRRYRRPLLIVACSVAVLAVVVGTLIALPPPVGHTSPDGSTSQSSAPDLPRSKALGDSELIVTLRAGKRYGLVVGDANDERRDRLTPSSIAATSANMSATRESIIYRRFESDPKQSSLTVMAASGGRSQTLISKIPGVCQPGIERPAWNPRDPAVLAAVCRDPAGHRRLNIISVDGKLLKTVDIEAFRVGDPTFSPDGSRLLFWAAKHAGHQEGGSLYVADENAVRPLTNSADGIDADPTWSPDGTTIAFRRNRHDNAKKPNGDIYTLRIDEEVPKAEPLLASAKIEDSPTFSPDGHRLAYRISTSESPTSRFRVWILDLRTHDKWPLWTDAASKSLDQSGPLWSRR